MKWILALVVVLAYPIFSQGSNSPSTPGQSCKKLFVDLDKVPWPKEVLAVVRENSRNKFIISAQDLANRWHQFYIESGRIFPSRHQDDYLQDQLYKVFRSQVDSRQVKVFVEILENKYKELYIHFLRFKKFYELKKLEKQQNFNVQRVIKNWDMLQSTEFVEGGLSTSLESQRRQSFVSSLILEDLTEDQLMQILQELFKNNRELYVAFVRNVQKVLLSEGPQESQNKSDEWSVRWHEYFVRNKNFVFVPEAKKFPELYNTIDEYLRFKVKYAEGSLMFFRCLQKQNQILFAFALQLTDQSLEDIPSKVRCIKASREYNAAKSWDFVFQIQDMKHSLIPNNGEFLLNQAILKRVLDQVDKKTLATFSEQLYSLNPLLFEYWKYKKQKFKSFNERGVGVAGLVPEKWALEWALYFKTKHIYQPVIPESTELKPLRAYLAKIKAGHLDDAELGVFFDTIKIWDDKLYAYAIKPSHWPKVRERM